MITIHFNEKIVTCTSSINLSEFLVFHAQNNFCYAIAVNNQFVAKSNYKDCILQEGDKIELIMPMQGG